MKMILMSAVALAVTTSVAMAEPTRLTDSQMDGITAGMAMQDYGKRGYGKGRYGKKGGGKQINVAKVNQNNFVYTPTTAVAIGYGATAFAGSSVWAGNSSFIAQGNF